MLVGQVINWKLKFLSYHNYTAREVGPQNRGAVPCIHQVKDGFHDNFDGNVFVGHNFQSFVEVMVDPLHHHRVVISTRKDVTIELREVTSFFAPAKKVTVLVQDNSMTETKAQLILHDCQCNVFLICMLYRFHTSKAFHTAAEHKISLKPLKS
jgi:hypothetical protein